MNRYTLFAKHFLSHDGWRDNCVIGINDGIVEHIGEGMHADYSAEYISHGLIDNHIHGGSGFHIQKPSEEGLEKWLYELAKAGVAAIMPAPYGSIETVREGLCVIKKVMEKQKKGECIGAEIIGVHLEGPFISEENIGAFYPDDVLKPSIDTFKKIADGYENIICEVTLAPEVPGADELIEYLVKNNIKVQAGHTLCDYDTAISAFRKGVGGICHTFNCSTPIHHRNAGILNAALTEDDIYCEMIADLKHLHPSTIKLLMRAKKNTHVMIVSDAVMTANCPDGIYDEGDMLIEVKDGVAHVLGTNTLAGANCYTSKSVKNLVEIGIKKEDAFNAGGRNVAHWLNIKGLGTKVGEKALFTAWNEDITPEFTAIGDKVYKN